jgi:hypothetical protein
MRDEPMTVSLGVSGTDRATMRRLDDQTAHLAASDPAAFRGSSRPIDATNGSVSIDLPPFGLATVDMDVAPA